MKSLIIKKIFSSILVVFLLTILIFLLVHMLPGDPIETMLGDYATEEAAAALRAQYNLDKPLPIQYFIWMGNIIRGDWGVSITSKTAVMPQVLNRLPPTLMLCLIPSFLSLGVAIILGVISASRHNSPVDLGISIGSLALLSVPEFWMGILLLFAVVLNVLPAGGYVKPSVDFGKFLKSITLPVVTMILHSMPSTIRMVRSSMLEVLQEDYIMLARTKGNSPVRCNYIHGLRNSLIPIATNLSLQITSLMAGVIVIEKVFQFPGMGLLLLTAITNRDYPMIQACIFVFSIIVVTVNLLTDIVYALIDPRIRYS
jgi:peptide/nickel transport system permease protein